MQVEKNLIEKPKIERVAGHPRADDGKHGLMVGSRAPGPVSRTPVPYAPAAVLYGRHLGALPVGLRGLRAAVATANIALNNQIDTLCILYYSSSLAESHHIIFGCAIKMYLIIIIIMINNFQIVIDSIHIIIAHPSSIRLSTFQIPRTRMNVVQQFYVLV